ncbi:MAG TPA: murein L,D-transpeptidase catalytic domain family protein [Thermoanaerobaculia bacterium]|nr:murein L,D-transpeptidase catalytic domain family protein [Thermoanaerobaculia bacterium]
MVDISTVRNPRVRVLGKALRLPAILLTLAGLSAGSYLPEVSTVDAAPAPAPVVEVAPAPAAVPAAVPAIQSPATTLLAKGADGLSPKVLAMALDAVACAKTRGVSGREDLLTVIDYSLPSTEPRLWVLDLERGEVIFHELVAHGRGTGDNYATRFSNLNDSHQTSLGLFRTGGTYQGGNGYSMKLQGLDKGFNDRAEARYIVMHGAWYVSEEQARTQGRLGRSWGCPALSEKMAPKVIDTIKGGSFVFSYGGDQDWLQAASSNTCGGAGATTSLASL